METKNSADGSVTQTESIRKELSAKFLSKSTSLKIVLHKNESAMATPPYYISIPRSAYLHFFFAEIRTLFDEFYSFGDAISIWMEYRGNALPCEVPYGALQDAFFGEKEREPPCIVMHYRFSSKEPRIDYIDHFKYSLKEAAYIKTGSGDAFKYFSNAKSWQRMFEAIKMNRHSELLAIQKPLIDRFSKQVCPVRVFIANKNLSFSRVALHEESIAVFLLRSFPKLVQKVTDQKMESLVRVLCGGINIPLELKFEAIEGALRFADCFVYLTIKYI